MDECVLSLAAAQRCRALLSLGRRPGDHITLPTTRRPQTGCATSRRRRHFPSVVEVLRNYIGSCIIFLWNGGKRVNHSFLSSGPGAHTYRFRNSEIKTQQNLGTKGKCRPVFWHVDAKTISRSATSRQSSTVRSESPISRLPPLSSKKERCRFTVSRSVSPFTSRSKLA